mmetsp:Transcript_14191/g.42852  ORF Transcript_14191/g.42852 Transcript_14191/m.42852 type:complete len:284 (-) Transcript_14191:277-1128(-)
MAALQCLNRGLADRVVNGDHTVPLQTLVPIARRHNDTCKCTGEACVVLGGDAAVVRGAVGGQRVREGALLQQGPSRRVRVPLLAQQVRHRANLGLALEGGAGAGGTHDLGELAVVLSKAHQVGRPAVAQHVPRLGARPAHVPLCLLWVLSPGDLASVQGGQEDGIGSGAQTAIVLVPGPTQRRVLDGDAARTTQPVLQEILHLPVESRLVRELRQKKVCTPEHVVPVEQQLRIVHLPLGALGVLEVEGAGVIEVRSGLGGFVHPGCRPRHVVVVGCAVVPGQG